MAGRVDVSVSTRVDATGEVAYPLVADLPRTGEWSRECTSVAWRGGATSAGLGATFRGMGRTLAQPNAAAEAGG